MPLYPSEMLQHTDVLDNTLSPDDDKLNFPAMQGATPSHDGCLDSDETKQGKPGY